MQSDYKFTLFLPTGGSLSFILTDAHETRGTFPECKYNDERKPLSIKLRLSIPTIHHTRMTLLKSAAAAAAATAAPQRPQDQ